MTKRRSAPIFQAEPGLPFGAGLAANGTRIELLERIAETGSITAAAKTVGLSYKAAWDAIAAMNNLADRPLFERSTGGRDGGTRLAARGRELVQSFRRMELQHRRFIESLNETGAQDGDNWRVLGRLAMQTSARNQFAGRVAKRTRGAVNDEIELRLSGGETLVATVTCDSSEALGLKRGAEAIALVKASSIIVAVDGGTPLRLSARNQLRGTVEAVHKGAVNSEVLIALAGGNAVVAIITNGSAETLGLVVERRTQGSIEHETSSSSLWPPQ